MYDFHITDYIVQDIPESKFYWHNLFHKCAIAVQDSESMAKNPDADVTIYFYQALPDIQFFLSNPADIDKTEIATNANEFDNGILKQAYTFSRRDNKVIRPVETKGIMILNRLFDLIDAKSWKFPRATAIHPYISKTECELMEAQMQGYVQSYIEKENPLVLSVHTAGTLLADRIGIQTQGAIDVHHYSTSNIQVDGLVEAIEVHYYSTSNTRVGGLVEAIWCPKIVEDKDVLVLDDLVSSGRTSLQIILHLLEHGAKSVTVTALYRTVASAEWIFLDDKESQLWKEAMDAGKIKIKTFFPLSNAYWVHGRGFDLTTDESRNTPELWGSLKYFDDETPEDVRDLLRYFHGNTNTAEYLEVLLKK